MPSTVPLLDAALPGGVQAGFTTRAGGRGSAPYDGLNLGDHVGDDPASVAAHREALRAAVSADALVLARQVHGADVVHVTGVPARVPVADALVTDVRGLALGVLVADCVPVLLCDVAAGLVAVAHAGRPGLLAGVVPAVVEALRSRGARDISASLGPSICGACYEVPPAMADDVAARVPAALSTTSWGTSSVDVAAGVLAQLAAAGVPASQVTRCTAEDADLFSYRRDGRTGRTAGVVVLR